MATLSPYISSSIAIAVVMFVSVLSAVLVCPLLNKSFSKHLLSLLTMLAVGTLCGDAIFHLIPHSLGLGGNNHSREKDSEMITVWKCSVIVASLYLFFIFNTLTNYFQIGHTHSHGHSHHSHTIPTTIEYLQSERKEHHNRSPVLSDQKDSLYNKRDEEKSAELTSPGVIHKTGEPSLNDNVETQNSHAKGKSIDNKDLNSAASARAVPGIVWMIVIGDILHNITDGLAVGASFAGGCSGGISTTLAILCHEIPHEIGDFVILLNAGLKTRNALGLTIITYIASFAGVFTGVALGEELNIVEWIFGVTAGMFLYIALVELLPDTIDDTEDAGPKQISTFLWQNVGFILGAGTMALIAAFEDSIKFHIGR